MADTDTTNENKDGIQKELNASDTSLGDTAGKDIAVEKAPVEKEAKPAADVKVEDKDDGAEGEKKTHWAHRRIDALTAEKWEERRKADALAKSNEALLAELAELRKTGGKPADPAAPVVPEQPKVDQAKLSEAEIEARANKLADEKAAQRAFDKACNETYMQGKEEYADFDRALGTFQMLGGIPRSLMELTSEMPAVGHKILYKLGKDPDLAEKIVKLPATKQAMELARMEAEFNKPVSAKVSKAKEPIEPITGSSNSDADPEKMSMSDYVKWRSATARKR